MHSLPVICLMGPTAAGKTDLAIELVEQCHGEIISVDSALIYKGMDIGTAKPDSEELARAPHALISFLDPSESYSVAEFRQDALKHINRIREAGKLPILVGGTMMYFKALLEGISELPEANDEIRAAIALEAEQYGWGRLHEELQRVDPQSAERIHPNDPQRINRAIEVYRLTGKSMTELTQSKSPGLNGQVLQFAIAPTAREVLHERIEKRFKLMIEAGFEAEVRQLYDRGDLHLNMPSMRCVGYRQMWEYFDGVWDHSEMIYRGIVATRQLAKRQMTWLNGWDSINWLVSGDEHNLSKVLKR